MSLERVLQIGVAIMVSLSSILLGMGENDAVLPVAAVIIAAGSVYVTDIQGWIRLGRRAGDIAGVIAALIAMAQWWNASSDVGLLALVNFIVYVQFVLQLKQKREAIYWLLIVLSLMQVSVATALNDRLSFGVLMCVYLIVAVGVLIVFYLLRENIRSVASETPAASRRPAGNGASASRWPVEPQARRFTGHLAAGQIDESLNGRLLRLILRLGATTLLMTVALFGLVPRSEKSTWRVTSASTADRTVGFANEVTLGELGNVAESTEPVMQVWLKDNATKQPYFLDGEPLFRGAVLTTYSDKRWREPELKRPRGDFEIRTIPSSAAVVHQRFLIRPLNSDALFSMYPTFCIKFRGDIQWDNVTEQIFRRSASGTIIDYEILTTGVINGRMSQVIPILDKIPDDRIDRLLALPLAVDGRDPLQRTKELAATIVRDIDPNDHVARARALADHLRNSSLYTYSLETVEYDASLDPVEDFIANAHAGNCEYFASALALMLRSVGIPARLAVGFKGGDIVDDYYQVLGMHAHAWVEAYLDPDHLPLGEPVGFGRENGGWLLLDPTAGDAAPVVMSATTVLIQALRQALSTARSMWNNYVLGMDYERQHLSIYDPVRRAILNLASGLTDRAAWKAAFANSFDWFTPSYWRRSRGNLFSWRGALAAIIVMLASVGLFRGSRAVARRLRRTVGHAKPGERRWSDVDFYRRFENLLAQHALVRAASQTPREFALAVGGQLAETPATQPAAALPRQLAEMFYRVRFGARPLDTAEVETVERALADLAGALALEHPRRSQDAR